MKQYQELLRDIYENGHDKDDRTGVGTRSLFGPQMRFNLQEGLPILTTKRVPFKLIWSELMWFLRGDSNIKFLLEHNNNIWNEWAFEKFVNESQYEHLDLKDFGIRSQTDLDFKWRYEYYMDIFKTSILTDDDFANKYGELGPVYGAQWRRWENKDGEIIDQVANVIHDLQHNPDSRRIIINAWNVGEIDNMKLPPCPTMIQFYVNDGKLSGHLYQRSADMFLGVPFDIVSYSVLIHLLANEVGLNVGELVMSFGDAHIYNNHHEQVEELLSREPGKLPELEILSSDKSLDEMDIDDLRLKDYKPQSRIPAPVAV